MLPLPHHQKQEYQEQEEQRQLRRKNKLLASTGNYVIRETPPSPPTPVACSMRTHADVDAEACAYNSVNILETQFSVVGETQCSETNPILIDETHIQQDKIQIQGDETEIQHEMLVAFEAFSKLDDDGRARTWSQLVQNRKVKKEDIQTLNALMDAQ